MADEELDEKDLKIKALEEELEQHKKSVSYTHLTLPTNREV